MELGRSVMLIVITFMVVPDHYQLQPSDPSLLEVCCISVFTLYVYMFICLYVCLYVCPSPTFHNQVKQGFL